MMTRMKNKGNRASYRSSNVRKSKRNKKIQIYELEIRPLKNVGNDGSKNSHQRATTIAPSSSFSISVQAFFLDGKKKRRPHYPLEQEHALLWEKLRRRNIAKEDRSKLISDALRKMKGKIPANCRVPCFLSCTSDLC
ncbi:hypothetical protein L2E82_23054 [Cichorium intybus]|uniref:Uncharacterized protein n=1 Tax=Cichorium intybus TaxID=13427 RepID=A0ACB9DZW9_CICIN|nr:hypothetical protein L2E82_23054 [Cichorium intybus]